jgi:hypothetical protein
MPRLSVAANIAEEAVPGGRIYEIEVNLVARALATEPESDEQVEILAAACEAWSNNPETPERLCTRRLKVWGLQPMSTELSADGDTLSKTHSVRVWAGLI